MKQDSKTRRQLEKEKDELLKLAEHDWLTGIYNRGAMETYVNKELEEAASGTMLVMDLDKFKAVNDRYGHIAGDRLLCYVSEVLKKLFPRYLVGRVGGDEFVVFTRENLAEASIEKGKRRIEERFLDVQLPDSVRLRLEITITGAVYRPGDQYQQLFDRADQQLLAEKKRKRESGLSAYRKDGLQADIQLIGSQLRETIPDSGAFCQDYESFKQIYRFVERRLSRSKTKVFLILFTLADRDQNFPDLRQRDLQVLLLGETIRQKLRLGDSYTQYSSCQFLVMVSDLTSEHVELVVERISSAFYQSRDPSCTELILHYSYPMQSVLNEDRYQISEKK